MESSRQLPLRIGLLDGATFDNFLIGTNGAVVHVLSEGDESFVYLWGGRGCGKSHLLQAVCHASRGPAAYLPLKELGPMGPAVLEGVESMDVVCIDQLEAVAGSPEWEQALFHLYNRVRDGGTRLRVAAVAAPGVVGIGLPDLVSRLGWGPVFHLQPLSDEEKLAALQQRAKVRGLLLSEEVGAYLLRHHSRDMHALFGLLERLDQASMAAQRRLTIPFIRELIG